MGFSAKEERKLLGGKFIDDKDALHHDTTERVVVTLIHVSALLHTFSASSAQARDFVREERFQVPAFDGRVNPSKVKFTTIADAFLSRDIMKFEAAPSWVTQGYLNFFSKHHNRYPLQGPP